MAYLESSSSSNNGNGNGKNTATTTVTTIPSVLSITNSKGRQVNLLNDDQTAEQVNSNKTESTEGKQQQSTKRRYHCTEAGCQKSFTTSGHLARHNRIHTGEKNFHCIYPGCPSRFSRQDNMMQHYRTHMSSRSRHHHYMHHYQQQQQEHLLHCQAYFGAENGELYSLGGPRNRSFLSVSSTSSSYYQQQHPHHHSPYPLPPQPSPSPISTATHHLPPPTPPPSMTAPLEYYSYKNKKLLPPLPQYHRPQHYQQPRLPTRDWIHSSNKYSSQSYHCYNDFV